MGPPKDNLRSGYTTGACAAAATRAGLLALIDRRPVAEVAIRLPAGPVVAFALHSCTYAETEGAASVIKDAGDDPDVTHGAEICARVTWADEPGVTFRRGVGVGLVTKKGLPVPPGEPAINPAPRRLIAETVAEVLTEKGLAGRGVVVEISVPRGEELAQKTFNPRLGIVGGISILGTTGIVVPYSTAAWLASVTQEIDVAAAQGLRQLVLTVGARGERLARDLFPLPEEAFVQIGPFFGDALRHCARAGIEKVILAAMIGKLAKFAAGQRIGPQHQQQPGLRLPRGDGAGGRGRRRPGRADRPRQHGAGSGGDGGGEGLREFFGVLCRKAWGFAGSLVGAGSRWRCT